ncbi:MAG: nucleotidyl transferase AbiEii/AbiGii toxin family protein [Candidatus Gracilibacteria bacterium]|nr:nucleotidyl transferase AbiEii/AbiGii toxin family protein [Candidatus Gracilibacteria bacterium]
MIQIQYIKSFYPLKEQIFEQAILKEYLQYQILNIVFSSKYAKDLSFLGGTAIRLIHNSNRFSEDLDFDNFGLNENDFDELSKIIKFEMEKLGFEVEIKNIYKGAFRCYIKLPKLLKDLGLSIYDDEKILVQLDTVKQDYLYDSDKKILDKFDVYKLINVCPIDIILSKKIHALIDRKRIKGRDFFDIVYLYKLTNPNFPYLKAKKGIDNEIKLKEKLLEFIEQLNLSEYAEDVKPFLINPDEINRVTTFKEFINSL